MMNQAYWSPINNVTTELVHEEDGFTTFGIRAVDPRMGFDIDEDRRQKLLELLGKAIETIDRCTARMDQIFEDAKMSFDSVGESSGGEEPDSAAASKELSVEDEMVKEENRSHALGDESTKGKKSESEPELIKRTEEMNNQKLPSEMPYTVEQLNSANPYKYDISLYFENYIIVQVSSQSYGDQFKLDKHFALPNNAREWSVEGLDGDTDQIQVYNFNSHFNFLGKHIFDWVLKSDKTKLSPEMYKLMLGNFSVDIVLNVPKLPPDKKFWEVGGNCNIAIAATRLGFNVGMISYGCDMIDRNEVTKNSIIGGYMIWTGLIGVRFCVDLSRTRRSRLLLNGRDDCAWNQLNTHCLAIGSISRSMAEDQENRFLVMVIRDLVNLCEITKGEDNKVVIVNNIMYVVGQYPQFLRVHCKLLKTVVKMLFEFMHETHPGVQDMVCYTLLKIVQKSKPKLVIIQVGENEPFVLDLLTALLTTIVDLGPHQIHLFYEFVSHMIQVEIDSLKIDFVLNGIVVGTSVIASPFMKSYIHWLQAGVNIVAATEVVMVVVYLATLLNIDTGMLAKNDLLHILLDGLASSISLQLLIPVLGGLGNLVTGNAYMSDTVLVAGNGIAVSIIQALIKCLGSEHHVLKKEYAWMLSNVAAGPIEHKKLIHSSETVICLLSTATFDTRKEMGNNQKVCSIVVENIHMKGQMLCKESDFFLEIAEQWQITYSIDTKIQGIKFVSREICGVGVEDFNIDPWGQGSFQRGQLSWTQSRGPS